MSPPASARAHFACVRAWEGGERRESTVTSCEDRAGVPCLRLLELQTSFLFGPMEGLLGRSLPGSLLPATCLGWMESSHTRVSVSGCVVQLSLQVIRRVSGVAWRLRACTREK